MLTVNKTGMTLCQYNKYTRQQSSYSRKCAFEGQHTYLSNAFFNVYSHHNGILLVENTVRQDAQYAGEDRVKLGSLLLLILHLPTAKPTNGKLC